MTQKSKDKTRARALRLFCDSTAPERLLWSVLRGRQLGGLKFRRQQPIEPYIVDFFCAEAKLIVELDGESHDGRQEYDATREEYLTNLGYDIMRVTNDNVFENLDGVVEFNYQRARTLP